MPAFPLPLLSRLTPADTTPVQAWWDMLAESDRRELLTLWSRRGNDCRFSRTSDGDAAPVWHRLPLVEAVFTDDDQPGDDWRPEWFDHLLSNIDLWERVAVRPRTFHFCTAHPVARAMLRAGFIPADFVCPLASAECPMRKLLDQQPGRSVRLRRSAAGGVDAREEPIPRSDGRCPRRRRMDDHP